MTDLYIHISTTKLYEKINVYINYQVLLLNPSTCMLLDILNDVFEMLSSLRAHSQPEEQPACRSDSQPCS
jgi:hypothetical protein